MSGTHLNDLSKVYLDQVAKVKKAETEADIQRWEDLGGPTPENYKPLDDSAKIKTEGYEATKKKEVLAAFKRDPKVRKRFEKAAKKEGGPGSDKNRAADDMLQTAKDIAKKKGDTSKSDDRYAYEGFSNWRQDLVEEDLIEIVDGPEDRVEKKVKEKKITNKIVINPKLSEAIEEIGGEVLELTEVEEKEEPKEDPALKSKEKKASMLKKQVLIKKLQAVRAGGSDITASYEPDIDGVIEYFYEEGINEEGFDQLIEEIGLEEFVDFVEGGVVELNEERAARRASVRAPSYEKVKAKVDATDAAKKKAKKGEYATSYAKKETDVTVYDDKPPAQKKVTPKKPVPAKKVVAPAKPVTPKKPVAPKKPVTKKVVKAVAKVKKTQPVKKATKQGLGDKIRGAYKAGVKRHRKATQGARVFGKGFAAGAKKAVKFAKDVKSVVSEHHQKDADGNEIPHDELEEELKKNFDEAKVEQGRSDYGKASVRNKRAFGIEGEPEAISGSKERGKMIDVRRYKHRTKRGIKKGDYKIDEGKGYQPEIEHIKGSDLLKKKKKVDLPPHLRLDVMKKAFAHTNKVSEGTDKALEYVRNKYKGQIYDPKKKQSPEDKAKVAAERKKRQDADNKAYASRAKKAGYKSTQDYTNVVARYGSEDNYRKGKGLGT